MGAARAAERPQAPDFGPLAESYDRLRPVDSNWWELFELLVAEGDLGGQRVLDVGCGTGRLATALAERGARVWGVDPSEDMLRQARLAAGKRVGLRRGRGEELPFKDAWFDRAVLRTVVHLLDRARALPELARVLVPGGRAVIASFAPEHFDSYWLNAFFPDVLEIDRARFPTPEELVDELATAGFDPIRTRRLSQRGSRAREEALEQIRGRYISTLRLLDEESFARGLTAAERGLPDTVRFTLDWVVLVAERP
ncbi:MAG TPA: methyltransferase domain-containing protein [Gaiellaceae bacterium]|nr:methyltransferase domain-containing protein [Gaiellaceae bacterium]